MDEKKIIEILKKHGVNVDLGANFSIKCQVAQLLNAISEIQGGESVQFDTVVKPPLGLEPQFIWKQRRVGELTDAIQRYVSGGFIGNEYKSTILKWMAELEDLLKEV